MRARWQCFGCGERYRRVRCAETCFSCGRAGYWTGSVDDSRGDIHDDSPDVETLRLLATIDAEVRRAELNHSAWEGAERERATALAEVARLQTIVGSRELEFRVDVADCAGVRLSHRFATLRGAAMWAADLARINPKDVVMVIRPGNVDLGCADGLTDEEREICDDARTP